MSLFTASLNSGSNGNCYYIGNDTEAVLIDAGISCRETEKRMKRCGLNMSKVKALFVSHEHADHISGITVLSKKYKLPVYITEGTLKFSSLKIEKDLVIPFNAHEPVSIGNLLVNSFPKFHDANDPHSFIVSGNGVTIGIITDIGVACDNVTCYFKQCHAAYLEANYDEQMLANGNYPIHLKKRISGGNGHISNNQALKLFTTHRPSFMSHIFLSHLSKNNNNPELVQSLFNQFAGKTKIVVASRYRETDVYQITVSGEYATSKKAITANQKHLQLSMF